MSITKKLAKFFFTLVSSAQGFFFFEPLSSPASIQSKLIFLPLFLLLLHEAYLTTYDMDMMDDGNLCLLCKRTNSHYAQITIFLSTELLHSLPIEKPLNEKSKEPRRRKRKSRAALALKEGMGQFYEGTLGALKYAAISATSFLIRGW